MVRLQTRVECAVVLCFLSHPAAEDTPKEVRGR
jgi:hypothetical protein